MQSVVSTVMIAIFYFKKIVVLCGVIGIIMCSICRAYWPVKTEEVADVPEASEPKKLPRAISASKLSPEKTIVLYEGEKYDITKFVKRHPGGKRVLTENNGKEISELMKETGHSQNALDILSKCKMTN